MKRLFLLATLLLLSPVGVQAQADPEGASVKPGYLKWLEKGHFATLLESQGTYQVRVMSPEQKGKAETAKADYAKQRDAYVAYVNAVNAARRRDRGAFAPADGAPAPEPELPAKVDPPARIATDLVEGTFYEIVDVEQDYVELKTGEAHVILPVASIRVILLGEKGSLGGTTRASSFPTRPDDGFRGPRGFGGEVEPGAR